VSADYFRLLHAYNRWANQRVLVKSGLASDADYHSRAAGLSFRSLHATLVHIVVGELVWLSRWRGELPPERLKDARAAERLSRRELPTLAAVRELWDVEDARQDAFFRSLGDSDIDRSVAYRTQFDEPNVQPLGQLIGHLVNHGTQFRAEAAVRLTQLDLSPGDLDLIVYLRGTGAGLERRGPGDPRPTRDRGDGET